MWPDFYVIGAYRSGTTALYRMLRHHPQVFLPLEKEPNFFAVDGNPDASATLRSRSTTGRTEYERLYRARRPDQRAGDISPEYLRNPWTAGRLRALVPDAPLVAILRNPIDRAYSDFLLHVRDGNETCRSFAEALQQQEGRSKDDHRAGHYIDTGLYTEQLERYLDLFPERQLQVHLFEDLTGDRDAVLAKVFRHIGVDDRFRPVDEQAVNASGVPQSKALGLLLKSRRHVRPYINRSVLERARPAWDRFLSVRLQRPAMSDAERGVLRELYRDEILRLSKLLERDLSHWLEG